MEAAARTAAPPPAIVAPPAVAQLAPEPTWPASEPVEPVEAYAPYLAGAPTEDSRVASRPIRIVLVEDVPEVAAHVRAVLRPQSRFNLVHVISDGRHAADEIRDLHPDVVLVDSLLQGKVSGPRLVERLRDEGSMLGIVALTVPDHPADNGMLEQVDAAVALPFGTFDLGRGIVDAYAALTARDPGSTCRMVSVFSAKGGVGKTTIAFNLATSLAATGLRTLLVDGCLQFGDVRRLLRVGPAAPSICDLPTDYVRDSDLEDAVTRAAPGVDALLAPSRPELAELITASDLERLLDTLRHAYQAIVIDTPTNLAATTLAILDASDLIIDVLTADAGTIEVTRTISATFEEIGYAPSKVRYLVNRADSMGAAPISDVARAIGRQPDYALASDWPLVSSSTVQGVPYVLARPDAPVSVGLRRIAEDIRALTVAPVLPVPVRHRARLG